MTLRELLSICKDSKKLFVYEKDKGKNTYHLDKKVKPTGTVLSQYLDYEVIDIATCVDTFTTEAAGRAYFTATTSLEVSLRKQEQKTYRELAEIAHNYDVSRMTIANECACIVPNDYEDFEDFCEVTHQLWINTENIAIESIANTLYEAIENGKARLCDITKGSKLWDAIIEEASYKGEE